MQAKKLRTIKPGTEYNRYFDEPSQTDSVISPNATIPNTVGLIKTTVKNTLTQSEAIAKVLKGSNVESTCRNIWEFLYRHIQYRKDAPGKEQIRSPRRAWSDRKAGIDCDCYTTFISSILTNLRIPHILRVTKYKADWQHIYVIVPKDGNTNISYSYGGNYYIIDPVTDAFDYEVRFSDKQDYAMKLEYLDGIEGYGFGDLGKKPKDYSNHKPGEYQAKQRKTIFGKALQKIGKGVAKVGLAPVRSAYLLALKTNIAKLASRLRWAYTTPEIAASNGKLSADQYQRAKMQLLKIQDKFAKAGGNVINLKNAILRGKGNKDNKVPLSGLEGYYDLDFDGLPDADWSMYGTAQLGSLLSVSGLGDLGIAAAAVLPVVLAVINAAAKLLKDIPTGDGDGEESEEYSVEGLEGVKDKIAKTQRLISTLETKAQTTALSPKEQNVLTKAKAALAKLTAKSAKKDVKVQQKVAKKEAKVQQKVAKKEAKVQKKAAKKQLKPAAQKLAVQVASIDKQIKDAEFYGDDQLIDSLKAKKASLLETAKKQKISLADILNKAAEIVGKVVATTKAVKEVTTIPSQTQTEEYQGSNQNSGTTSRNYPTSYPTTYPSDNDGMVQYPTTIPTGNEPTPPYSEAVNNDMVETSGSNQKGLIVGAAIAGGLLLVSLLSGSSNNGTGNRRSLNGAKRKPKGTHGFAAVSLA